jgi:N-acyl-D-aspartate/D-glutamate deacylase
VAIDGRQVTAVGAVDTRGYREIDARGRLVTPGFIDVHTHLDAQLLWDPGGTSSCSHGVTTVVMANCGVTFAPVRPVRKLSAEGVDLFGLHSRGILAPGAVADVNVIDVDSLELPAPMFVHDLPLGGGRYVQGSRGYDYTLVNGTIVVNHGQLTGAPPGRVLAHGPSGV